MTAPSARSAWTRLRHTLSTLGPLNGVLYLTDRLLSRLSAGRVRLVIYRVVAQPVGRAGAMPVRAGASSTLEEALPGHAMASAFPRPASVIAMRYANGARCLVAAVKAQFAGYLWWQRERYDEDEVRCRYLLARPEESAWDFDVYVEPRFRLGRTLALLWQAADARMAAEGVRWTFSRISTFNAESLASHARLGAVPVARAAFVVAGPAQLALFDRSPFVHLSLSGSAWPTLAVSPPSSSTLGAPAR